MLSTQFKTLLLCLLLTPLMALGLDLYTPSLPAIARYFNVSHFAANLSIILYIAAFGLSQPIMGVIADRSKRKLFILIALILYCLSSFLCSEVKSIAWLYFFRIISSVCASCTAASIKILIAENFTGKMLAKASNYYALFWSITPIVAPVIGGYLQHSFGWQSNFYFMGAYSFICLLLCFFMIKKKSSLEEKKGKLIKSTLLTWKTLLTDPMYIASVFILSVENALLFLYYTTAPYVIQIKLHFNAADYGKIVLFIGVSYIIGNIINGRLLNYVSTHKIIYGGVLVSVIISIVFLIFSVMSTSDNIYLITIPVFMLFICDGLIFSNIISTMLARYNDQAGAAGGLLGGLLNIVAALIVGICAMLLNLHHLSALSAVYCILLLLSLFAFLFFMRP